jgi:hypothetical protein
MSIVQEAQHAAEQIRPGAALAFVEQVSPDGAQGTLGRRVKATQPAVEQIRPEAVQTAVEQRRPEAP